MHGPHPMIHAAILIGFAGALQSLVAGVAAGVAAAVTAAVCEYIVQRALRRAHTKGVC